MPCAPTAPRYGLTVAYVAPVRVLPAAFGFGGAVVPRVGVVAKPLAAGIAIGGTAKPAPGDFNSADFSPEDFKT